MLRQDASVEITPEMLAKINHSRDMVKKIVMTNCSVNSTCKGKRTSHMLITNLRPVGFSQSLFLGIETFRLASSSSAAVAVGSVSALSTVGGAVGATSGLGAVRTVDTMRATSETDAAIAVGALVAVGAVSEVGAVGSVSEVGAVGSAGAANAAAAESAASASSAAGVAGADVANFPANTAYDRSRHRNKNAFLGSMDICDELP